MFSQLSTGEKFLGNLFAACLILALLIGLIQPFQFAAAQSAPPKIESDDVLVTPSGTWLAQTATTASGGSYLYNVGAGLRPAQNEGASEPHPYDNPTLSLKFTGPAFEILYVSGPNLGTLAIEVDGTVLRTVITTDTATRYGQSAKIAYLTDGPHELKVYAQAGGVVAVDAFVVSPASNTPTPELVSLNDLPADPRYPICNPTDDLVLISRTAGNISTTVESYMPKMSADGRFITYLSRDTSIPLGTSDTIQIMHYDRATCTLVQVAEMLRFTLTYFTPLETQITDTVAYDFSENGRYITFTTRADLNAQDTLMCSYMPAFHGAPVPIECLDIYRLDLVTGTYELVNIDAQGAQRGNAYLPEISADGNHVAFTHTSTIYVRDMQTDTLELVPVTLTSTAANASFPRLSADGRYVSFVSSANNLVPGDTGQPDVFVRDLQTDTTTRVSVATDGTPANGSSGASFISTDGQFVVFSSTATNLSTVDTTALDDIYVHDLQTHTTSLISAGVGNTAANNFSAPVGVSAGGRYVTFASPATNLIAGDTNGLEDYFLRDRQTNTTYRLFENTAGLSWITHEQFSSNYQVMTFASASNNLVMGDTNNLPDVFLQIIGLQPDKLALWNSSTGQVGLLNSQSSAPNITTFTPGPPATGQLVMGDWDGDSEKSAGIYAASGVFYYTNQNTAAASWSAIWLGLAGRPAVAGRFDAGVNHDCVGAVDSANFPPYGTAYALYFACDLTHNTAPALTFQWLSVLLPNSGGFTGTHQFSAGDFDGDGVDSIAVRRGPFITFTNDDPTTLAANFPLAQYFGTPATTDEGRLVVGDWDGSGAASFGLFYQSGNFYWRDDLDWNSGLYFNQQVGQPIGTPVQAAAWH